MLLGVSIRPATGDPSLRRHLPFGMSAVTRDPVENTNYL